MNTKSIENANPKYLNDAELIGSAPSDMDEFLSKPVTFLIGEQWNAPGGPTKKGKKNTQDGEWKPLTLPLQDWIFGQPEDGKKPAWGLSRHPVGEQKEGASIVLGSSIGGARKAVAMDTMYAMGLDIDSGSRLNAVIDKIESLGLFCLIYTSYNDGRSGLELKRDEVLRKLQIKSDPTLDEVKAFLRLHAKGRYEESFIDSVQIADPKRQTVKGAMIALDTPPLDKFRLIFPLAEPVRIIDLADTHAEALAVWEDKITGLARNALGIHFDTSCSDPSRLFYAPRHSKDGQWYSAIVRGSPVDFATILPMSKASYTANRGADNPFAIAGGDNNNNRPAERSTPSGKSLNDWHRDAKARFMIANLLEDHCQDYIRVAGGEGEGQVHTECPFEHEHTSEGGTGTMAINALDAQKEVWTWFCKHDACQGRYKLEFLEEALRAGWFEEDLLFDLDEGYLLDVADGKADPFAPLPDEFEPVKDWLPKWYSVSGGAISIKDEEDGDRIPICAAFDVVGRSSNADGTEGAGRIISFVNENGKRVEVTISRADLFADGAAVMRELADRGLVIIGRGRKANDRLLDLLNSITPQRQVPTVNVPGWVRNDDGDIAGFMHPNGGYARVSGVPFRLLEGSRIEVVKAKGTLDGWKAAAAKALTYADSNFYWPLGMIAGFAGPILGILEWQPCGFSLSGLTSKGKTLAQIMGSAAWGSPEPGRGVLFTANTTGNAMEDLAVRGTDTFLAMDEIGSMSDKKALGSILFALSTGRTKSRKSGTGRGLTEGDNFRPFTILSSENGMKNEIAGAGDKYRGGLAVRFPDIDVSEGRSVSPDEITALDAFKANYGHAGPVFVRHLIDAGIARDRAKLEKEVLAIATRLSADKGAAMARAARVFAVAQRAGELAADAALLGDARSAKIQIGKAVQRAWDVFTVSDEAGAATGGDALLDALRSFLFGELNRRIVVMDNLTDVSDGHVNARGEVLGWADGDVIYLDSSKVKDPSVLGLDIGKREELTRQLKELGVLIAPDGKGHTFRQLPKELAEGSAEGAAVRNIRLCRKKLEI